MKQINKINDYIIKACRIGTAAIFVFICAAVILQVVVRKLGGDVPWVDELTRYSFVLSVLYGSVGVVRKGDHIRITSFLNMVPPTIRRYLDALIYAIVIAFSMILVYAYVYAINYYEGATFNIVTSITMSGYYTAVAVGMALITLSAILYIIDILTGKVKYEIKQNGEA